MGTQEGLNSRRPRQGATDSAPTAWRLPGSVKSLRAILTLLIVGAVAAVLALVVLPPLEQKPSVILITVDTLRPDHLSCYGYEHETSPALSRFASEALLFDQLLPDQVDTLAEMLQRNGYRTLAVVSNYVLQRDAGWDQGFDVYDQTMTSSELNRKALERIAPDTTDRAIEMLQDHQGESLFLWVHY